MTSEQYRAYLTESIKIASQMMYDEGKYASWYKPDRKENDDD